MNTKVRSFSLLQYVDAALGLADYTRDEDGVIIAEMPGGAGFFAQGENFEETRANLRHVIEGNVLIALQLGLPILTVSGSDQESHPNHG